MNKFIKSNQHHIDRERRAGHSLFTALFDFTSFMVRANEGKKYVLSTTSYCLKVLLRRLISNATDTLTLSNCISPISLYSVTLPENW